MQYQIELPSWVVKDCEKLPTCLPQLEDRMETIIRFARSNFEYETGGPFAAGVFDKTTGRVVSIGVNRVVPCLNSSAHAEIVAISLAQQKLQTFDLGADPSIEYQLVVNGRPCAMCFGAIPWSGIRSVVYAASGEQIEQITGFDEGPIHPQWQSELQKRGIEVVDGVLAEQACDVFRQFAASGQPVYNSRAGGPPSSS